MNVANDGELFARGMERLPEREDVRSLCGQILHGGQHFGFFFAEAEHQPGFGRDVRVSLFGAMEKFQRTLVESAFAYLAVKAGHGFGVVIQHVGANGENAVQRVPVAAKIGDQDFDFASGNAAADFFDCTRKNFGAAIRLVVAIDAGDYGVAQAHAGDSFGDAKGFIFIGRADRFSGRNRAKTAGAGTDIAKNHESGGAVFPAFAHVGAAGAFADGVEIESTHGALQILIAFAAQEFDAEPV